MTIDRKRPCSFSIGIRDGPYPKNSCPMTEADVELGVCIVRAGRCEKSGRGHGIKLFEVPSKVERLDIYVADASLCGPTRDRRRWQASCPCGQAQVRLKRCAPARVDDRKGHYQVKSVVCAKNPEGACPGKDVGVNEKIHRARCAEVGSQAGCASRSTLDRTGADKTGA